MHSRGFVYSALGRTCSIVVAFLLAFMTFTSSASGAFAQEAAPSSPTVPAATNTVTGAPDTATASSALPASQTTTPTADATAAQSPATPTVDASAALATQPPVAQIDRDPLPPGATEIVSKRDRFTTTYALPDGKDMAVISAGPVHYLDGASKWQNIDTQMVPDSPSTYRNAANDFRIQAGDDATSAPVSVSKNDWKVSLDLQGASDGEPIVAGNDASYVGTSTTLAYTSVPQGLKETIYLASADAPDTYTFAVDTSGCAVTGDAQAGYFLRQLGSPDAVGEIDPLVVSDSSTPATTCASATMQVTPTASGATVTYHIPRAWIDDPARVFPIVVDPGVTVADTADTWVYAGAPTSNYNTDTRLDIGNPGSSTTGWYRSFVRFDLSSLYGVNIDSATLDLYYAGWANSNTINCLIEEPPTDWNTSSVTWNTQPNISGSTLVTSQTVGGTTQKWDYFDVTSAMNYFVGNTTSSLPTNVGFRVRTSEGTAGFSHYYQFVSANDAYSPHWPQVSVTYDAPSVSADTVPSGTVSADGSTTTTLTVRAAYPLPSGFPGASMIRYVEVQANASSPSEQVGDWAWSDASGSGALTPTGVIAGISTNWAMSTDASGTRVLSLGFTHSSSYPNAQNVSYKVVRVATSPSIAMYNSSETTSFGPWSLGGSLSVLPAAVTISSGSSSVASCGTWYQPQDANLDGVVDNPDNTNAQGGRGWANLVWPSGGAISTGYHIYMSDGYTMRQVASITGSGTTSWTTHNAGLYPGDSTIASLAANTTSSSFLTTATGGLDLRDNPNALYSKTAGTSLDGSSAYDFKVVPCNAIGEAPSSQCGTWAATLPNSSLPTAGPQPPVFYSPTPASCATTVGTLAPTISIGTSSTAAITTVTATVAGVAASATFSPTGASVGTITVSIPGGHLTSGYDLVQVSASNATTTGATAWWFIVAGATLSNPLPANNTTITTQTSYATCAISAPAGITTSSVTALVDGNVAPVSFASGIASVTLPALLAGTHTVSVSAADNFGLWGLQNLTWSFNVPMPPAPVTASASTTSSANWFTESDTNGDGINDTPDDANTSGRGAVNLTWPAASGATSYHVYLFDGATWRQVASTTSTSWSSSASSGSGVYPTDSAINALPQNTTSNPFLSSGGLDLRDDPAAIYAKTGGTAMSTTPDYFFKVAPFDGGETPLSTCPTLTVELANRSVRVDAEPMRTTYDAGEMAGHSATVFLDGAAGHTQRLELATTDLKVASFGPAAEVSRVYRSDLITPGSNGFAPGWFFNFDSSVVATSGGALYTDTDGQTHEFYAKAGGGYLTPQGMDATLTGAPGSGFTLAQYGGEVTTFDSTDLGRIASESDRNGNQVTYAWAGDGSALTITAANVQAISVALSGGQVTSAKWLSREFDYATDTGVATVTCYAGTPAAYTVVYTYSNGELSSLSVPAFGTVGGESATWGFAYSGSQVTDIDYPGWGSSLPDQYDYQTVVAYGSGTAWVARRGTVGGQPNTYVTTTYAWNPDGSRQTVSNPNTSDQLTTDVYDASGNELCETDQLGRTTSSIFDAQGDELVSTDASGNVTTKTFDRYGDPLVTIDPRGAVTTDTYDSNGNLSSESKTLDASDTAWSGFGYDPHGQETSQVVQVTPTQTITTLSTYDPSGQVASTRIEGVALDASSSAVQDITTSKSYDTTGNLVTETDALSNPTTYTYDAAGRQLSSTDPSGTVSHTAYDCLGNTVGTWKSGSDGSSAECVSSTVLPSGQTYVQTTWADASSTTPAQVTTTTYDGLGDAISSADSVQGNSLAYYDASGRATCEWAAGTDCATVQQATRTSYDAAGQVTSETPAGNVDASSTVTTYDAGGHKTKVTDPDGSWSTYTYDTAGNQTSVTSPDDTSTATSYTAYDLGGRAIETTDQVGATSLSFYDLAGRLIASGGSSAADPAGMTTAFDNAGWTVRSVDAAGVVTSNTIDADGRVVASSVGGKTTLTTYDACGRVVYQLNPDLSSVTYTYDPFGRQSREVHMSAVGIDVKDIATGYDGAGRVTTSADTKSHITRAMAYSSTQASATVTTLTVTPRPDTTFTQANSSTGAGQDSGDVVSWTSPRGSVAITRSVTATDTAGRTTAESIDNGLTVQRAYFAYDALGRIVGQNGWGLSASATVSYDASTGLKTSDSWPYVFGSPGAPQRDSYSYTADGRLSHWQATDPWGRVSSETVTYDGAGDISNFSGLDASGTNFFYDNTGANGHVSGSNCASSVTGYTYDPQTGARTAATTWYTGGGSTGWSYVYDDAGRLSQASENGQPVSSYTYDGDGQRVSAITTSGAAVTAVSYSYEGLQLDALAATTSVGGSVTETYTATFAYNASGRPYAAVFDDSVCASQPVYFSMVTNDHGDVTELVDQQGQPFVEFAYDPWGACEGMSSWFGDTLVPGAAVSALLSGAEPMRYAGYVYDSGTKLYYCSARYYDPATMQFLTPDPAQADGEESAYQYCGGDPVNKLDPSGRWSIRNSLHFLKDYWYALIGATWYGRDVWRFRVLGYGIAGACRNNPYERPLRGAITGMSVSLMLMMDYGSVVIVTALGAPPKSVWDAACSVAGMAVSPSIKNPGAGYKMFRARSESLMSDLIRWESHAGHYYAGTHNHKSSR